MKFAIFGNTHQSKKSVNIATLFTTLNKYGDSYCIDRTFYELLKETCPQHIKDAEIIDGNDFTADVVISYGGDGTLLRTAGRVGSKGFPILGINAGRLGFLTTVSHNDIENIIKELHNGNCETEERSLIEVTSPLHQFKSYPYALNEIAVMKHDSSSMMTISVSLDGHDNITYQADGLIVATPSGSTGYSLSVGGPIISPESNVIVLTPIASHSLGARPIVLSDTTEVKIEVSSRSHNFLIAIDGRNESCNENAALTIKKAPHSLRLIRCKGQSFIKNLRDKMMWGADIR